jgi:hypothetical protein
MEWGPSVGGVLEFMEMVFVLVKPLPSQDSEGINFPEASPKLIVGSVHSDVLISVTDKVAEVDGLSSWRVLAEMVADKVGVGVTGNTVKVCVMDS